MGENNSVSIPYLSGHPFLQGLIKYGVTKNEMCQSPIYQDTPFYFENKRRRFEHKDNVSIPYLSGHPFLLEAINNTVDIKTNCVNPLSIRTPLST